MAYASKNPKVNTQILTDQVAAAVDTPASGSSTLINRNGSLYMKDSSGVETAVGSAGLGEINYITNPSAAAAITGWVASGAGITVARTTTGANLPRESTTPSGIQITNVSGTDYVRYRFTLDDVDKSVKLKIQFALKPVSGYASNDMFVAMYTNSASNYGGSYTKLVLGTDVSGVTGLPNGELTYITTFDATTADYYELRIGRTAGTSSIVVADVIVGPGSSVQGAAVSEWQTYTPTGSWVSNTTYTGRYRRVGDTMELECDVVTSGAPTSADLTISIPSGFTVDTTKLTTASVNKYPVMGSALIYDSPTTSYLGQTVYSTTSTVNVICPTSGTNAGVVNQVNPITFGASDRVTVKFAAPIAEWAGGGTIANNFVEYAYNTSGITSAGATDTTAFAYGPAGALIGSIASSTTTLSFTTMRVRFQRPIQPSDIITVETDDASVGVYWLPVGTASTRVGPFTRQGTAAYGITFNVVNATDVDVSFANAGRISSNTSYAGAGGAWSSVSVDRWRVVKTSAGVPVSFGLASATQSGLVSSFSSGTWTPGIAFNGGTTGLTYATQTGTYTKIGNMVFCWFDVALSAKGSSTGGATLTGLPFSATASSLTSGVLRNINMTSSSGLFLNPNSSGTSIPFRVASATTAPTITDTSFADNTEILGGFSYSIS